MYKLHMDKLKYLSKDIYLDGLILTGIDLTLKSLYHYTLHQAI